MPQARVAVRQGSLESVRSRGSPACLLGRRQQEFRVRGCVVRRGARPDRRRNQRKARGKRRSGDGRRSRNGRRTRNGRCRFGWWYLLWTEGNRRGRCSTRRCKHGWLTRARLQSCGHRERADTEGRMGGRRRQLRGDSRSLLDCARRSSRAARKRALVRTAAARSLLTVLGVGTCLRRSRYP